MEQPRVVLASLVCVILLAGLQVTRAQCQVGEVYCWTTDDIEECIPTSRVCDGVVDCYYTGRDEDCDCSLPFEEVSSSSGSPCVLLDVLDNTWQEARDVCRSLDADLAILHDGDFYRDLIDYMHNSELAYHDYWVGATDQVEEGVWTWVDGTPVRKGTPLWGLYYKGFPSYTYHQEPYSADAEGEDCGYLQGDQYNYMVDGDCTKRMTSICQKKKTLNLGTTEPMKDASINATTITPTKAVPSTKTCTAPFEALGQRCVWLEMEELAWLEVLYLCRRFGADLASISDIGLHADLVDYFDLKGVTDTSFWTGANDTANEGQWKWLDGQTVRMGTPLWRTMNDGFDWRQEPDTRFDYADRADCGILDHEAFHYMADADCTSKLPAVCLMP